MSDEVQRIVDAMSDDQVVVLLRELARGIPPTPVTTSEGVWIVDEEGEEE